MRYAIILALMSSLSMAASFAEVTPDQLKKLQKNGTPVIDIRTPQEWKDRGIIKGAHKMMFFTPKGEPNVAEWMFDLGHLVKDKKEPFIIYCAHANRTKTLGKWLTEQFGFEKVYELKGGIEYGWIDKKEPVVK